MLFNKHTDKRKVYKGRHVMFHHMCGKLFVATVEERRGERVTLKDKLGNTHAVYLGDIVGILKKL